MDKKTPEKPHPEARQNKEAPTPFFETEGLGQESKETTDYPTDVLRLLEKSQEKIQGG